MGRHARVWYANVWTSWSRVRSGRSAPPEYELEPAAGRRRVSGL